MYALEIENLTKVYRNGYTALSDVSFKVGKGEIVGYLGPNGAGKTTTIKILTTLLKPSAGHAYVDGIDVNAEPQNALRNVGALIAVPGVYDYLTPHEMLTYFGKIHRIPKSRLKQRIVDVLKKVKLSDWEHKKIGSFSTGMARRLGIAKAMLHAQWPCGPL